MHHQHGCGCAPAAETDTESGSYVTPAVNDLGPVTKVTLGTAGFDRADDTEYFV
jgi:hypothetical protein